MSTSEDRTSDRPEQRFDAQVLVPHPAGVRRRAACGRTPQAITDYAGGPRYG
jgi:hypothetical protein